MTHPSEPPPPPPVYACLHCVGERKLAELSGTAEEDLPPIQIAVTLAPLPVPPAGVVAVPTCYGHLVVNKHSPLMTSNGGLPPGLRRPGG